MLVSFFSQKFSSHKKSIKKTNSSSIKTFGYSIIPSLKFDTISFGSLKKSQLNGIDLFVVEKFKVLIEKFHTNKDLQDWAEEEISKICQKDLTGRKEETKVQREIILNEWIKFLEEENFKFTKPEVLLILDAITKDLKRTNDDFPPKFNANILNDCITEANKKLNENRKYHFNLNKEYKTKLKSLFLGNDTENKNSFWIIIPSKVNDPKNYETNAAKLRTLSSKYWCTRGSYSDKYLSEGDFHIYFEKGRSKIGIRFIGENIKEIQSENNSNNILLYLVPSLNKHLREGNYKLIEDARKYYEELLQAKIECDELKKILIPDIAENNIKAILNKIGIKAFEDSDGMIILDKYNQPNKKYTFTDLGIDENKLFEKVKEIKGNADFQNSNITNLQNLESIGGIGYFAESRIKDLGKLERIGKHATFSYSQIEDLKNLKEIGGNAYFDYSAVKTLNKLETIGGEAVFSMSQITDLGNLKNAEIAYIDAHSKIHKEDFKNRNIEIFKIEKT